MIPDIPDNHVAEISLIGTGGGYGESIVVHLGYGNWMVIDSCSDPKLPGSCLPLDYLRRIKVDPGQVKLILCTHWHDDHIRGISTLVEACPNAVVSFAWHHEIDAFYEMVNLDTIPKERNGVSGSSATRELKKSLEVLKGRGKKSDARYIIPHMDRTLFRVNVGGLEIAAISLSPSDRTIQNFVKEVVRILERLSKNPATRILAKKPNTLSVVTYLKLGPHRALLGADLEGSHSFDGWSAILLNSQEIKDQPPSGLFKIPHHGSKNAYNPDVWARLIAGEAVATLTPWNLSTRLPKPEMIEKYKSHTSHLYMTSPLSAGLSKEQKKLRAALGSLKIYDHPIQYDPGHIRSRIDLTDPQAAWQVAYWGSALRCV